MIKRSSLVRRFRREEDGIASVWHIMMAISMLAIGGFAIDHSRVMSEQIRLQVAADTTAHAAAWALIDLEGSEDPDERIEQARRAGMVYATTNLQSGRGEAIIGSDIQFGQWNQTTRTFTESETDIDAVRVVSRRTSDRKNPLPTTYLGLVDLPSFNVAAQAVFQLEVAGCPGRGMLAMGMVDISSGSTFESGYCVHGQNGVDMGNGNVFQAGTVVSMPSLDLLDGSTEGNPGLEEALRRDRQNPPELWNIPALMDSIQAGNEAATGDWYTTEVAPTVDVKGDLSPTDLKQGSYQEVTCKGKHMFIGPGPAGEIYENVVIRTTCAVTFRAGVRLENAVIMSESMDKKAFSAPSGLSIGKDDTCAEGGNVLLITTGGMEFASKIEMHGSQLIAGGDVQFSASGTGVYGGQILAGGNIYSTSNLHFGPCPRMGHVISTMEPVMRL